MVTPSEIHEARILIVDDQAANLTLLEQLLLGAGYTNLTCTRNPLEVCALHRRHSYDLVLLDLQMPGMNGFQVMEKLNEIEPGGLVPVLVITAEPAHKLRALKAGAKDFVSKPVDLQELLLRVYNLLEVRLLRVEAALRTKLAEASEQGMRASELSYRRLFEAARDGILILEVETGRITDVNPFLVELLGFSHDEMIGKTAGELSPFKDIESNQLMLERLQRDGYVRYENLPLQTRDGRHVDVEFVSNVYRAGDCDVIQCNIRDVTARRKVEQAQRTSEARYRTLFDYAPDGIVIADAGSTYTDANASMCRMLGYTHLELVGLHARDIVVPSEVAQVGPALEVIRSKSGYHREWQFRRKDGSCFAADVIATQMPDGNLLGVIRDITDRKFAEAKITGLAAIVESSDDAIIGKDLKGIVTSWNRGAEKLFGHTSTEIVGTSIMRLIPPERQQEETQIIEKLKRGESVEHFETQRLARSGQLINVLVTVSPIRDILGQVIGVSKVVHDITDRKAAEERIHQLNVGLEERVAERTVQLQAANKELEAFSYSVSHDLRAPLRHVMGFVELLQKEAGPTLSEKSHGRLTTISQAAKRMGMLIDDLLAFSRVGRTALVKTTIDLAALVRDCVADFQVETRARNLAWDIQPLPPVQADRALLRMVLVNLLSNAVKFTGQCAAARIEIGVAPGGAGETVIFVRDNGAGFDPQYAGKLFGVFQRLHSQAEFEGTGIGLANVERIIHRHGGRVWAEGTMGTGATFYFSIPHQPEATHGH